MSLSVLPNTPVLPAWNRLARAVEGLRIIGGDGINLVQTRNGIVISPHPRAKRCTAEAARVVLEAAVAAGAPLAVWIRMVALREARG